MRDDLDNAGCCGLCVNCHELLSGQLAVSKAGCARLGWAVAAAVAEAARLRPVVLGAVHEAHARVEAAPGRSAAVALRAHVPLREESAAAQCTQNATKATRVTALVPCPPCAWRSRRASSSAASPSSRSACPSRCEPGRQPVSDPDRREPPQQRVRPGGACSTAHGLFMPRMTWLTW